VACANSYSDGGISSVVFSPESKLVFTTGFDASLSCFKLRYDDAVMQIPVVQCMMGFQSSKVKITTSCEVKQLHG